VLSVATVTAAYALGIGLADLWEPAPPLALLLGLALLAAALVLPRERVRMGLVLLAASCAGCFALSVKLESARHGRPSAPVTRTLEGTVGRVDRAAGGFWLELADGVCADEASVECPERVRVRGESTPSGVPGLEEALPGQRLRLRVRLRALRDRHNPGSRGTARRLARRGVAAEARLVHPSLHQRLPEREGWRPLAGLHRLRAGAIRSLGRAGEPGGLVAALALGDRGALSRETRDRFAQLGLAHLLAVSGLHLALGAGLAYGLVRRLLGRSAGLAARADVRVAALILALVVAALQAVLAGFGVPVRRALAVVVALGLALVFGRPVGRRHVLLLAALWVLCLEPAALFEPGAQLSFAASGGLLLAAGRPGSERSSGRLSGWLERASDVVRTTVTATLATAPLAAWHLGVVAPAALVSNLVAVPLVGLVLLPLSLLAGLGVGLAPHASAPLVEVALAVACATLDAIEWAARLAPAWGLRPRLGVGFLALALVVSGLALRAPGTAARLVGACLVLGVLSAAPAPRIRPRPPRLVVLDVGQGDAILVEGREGALIVDSGAALPGRFDLGQSVVAPALAALGVQRLDLVVVTHADLDHRGGVPALLEHFEVGRLWLPHGAIAEPDFAAVLSAAGRAGVRVQERGSGSPPSRFGDVVVTPLWPPRGRAGLSRNDASLVLKVEAGSQRILLAGDVSARVEAELSARGLDLSAEVLLLPHHGSQTSSSRELLQAVEPLVAVVSAPCPGRFAWPHPDVVLRLRTARIPLWWTGRDGAALLGLEEPLWVRGLAPLADAACPPPEARRP
jgi:competence protein ComEC